MISFRVTGVESIIKNITNIQKTLPEQMENFLRNLMNAGIPIIDLNYVKSRGGNDYTMQHSSWVEVVNNGDRIVAKLIVEGEDLAFVEFGAGIFFHTTGHPLENEFGMGVGTYPNQTHAYDNFWWYKGEDGKSHFSKGIGAQMPVFKAGEEIANKFEEVARETFGV